MKVNILFGLLGALLLVVAVGTFFWLYSTARRIDTGSDETPLTSQLMRRKLEATQSVRDSIASEDMKQLQRAITLLWRVSETVKWYLSDQRTTELRAEFRRRLDKLDMLAGQGEISGLPAAYEEMLNSCIRCHQQEGIKSIDPIQLQLPLESAAN
jgi:hypothetical protein